MLVIVHSVSIVCCQSLTADSF